MKPLLSREFVRKLYDCFAFSPSQSPRGASIGALKPVSMQKKSTPSCNHNRMPYGIRRRLTLPGRCQPSTISAQRLNFCVRYGNRWIPLAIITGNCISFSSRLPSRLSPV